MSIASRVKPMIPPLILRTLLPPYRVFRRVFLQVRTRLRCRRFLSYPEPRRIELGPGMISPPPGWLTIDLMPSATFYWDLRRRLPLPESSVAEIYSSHVLEHFPLPELRQLVNECVRVLTPGGIFNLSVPNGGMYVRSYTDASLRAELLGYIKSPPDCELGTPMDVVNHIAHMSGEHRFLFDEANVVALLRICGLPNARIREFDPSRDVEVRRHESLYAIATKPFLSDN